MQRTRVLKSSRCGGSFDGTLSKLRMKSSPNSLLCSDIDSSSDDDDDDDDEDILVVLLSLSLCRIFSVACGTLAIRCNECRKQHGGV